MNIFKLVCIDSPHKIDLPVGTFVFGRGQLVKCDDKRVSRSHGELAVTDKDITLRSLHMNPCFYIKNGSNDKEILKLNCTITLGNGDKFGVLPDTCWYELVYCPDSSQATDHSTHIPSLEETNSESDNTELIRSSSNCSLNDDTSDHNASQPIDFDLNENTSNAGDTSPSTLIPAEDVNSVLAEPKTPQKRCSPTADSPVDVKKVKKESDNTNDVETTSVKKEPTDGEDVKPGTSNESVATAASDKGANCKDGDSPDETDSTLKPNAQLRERCMYGANCYRRNPQHKAQFSHPSDADWGPGAQAPCPRGAACLRRDPRHWRDHSHPHNTQPPAPRPDKRPKRKRVQPASSDSDEDSPSDLVVTGKRKRKPVQRMSWSESSNEDPYRTDESDEWEPPSDLTGSMGYSQETED